MKKYNIKLNSYWNGVDRKLEIAVEDCASITITYSGQELFVNLTKKDIDKVIDKLKKCRKLSE